MEGEAIDISKPRDPNEDLLRPIEPADVLVRFEKNQAMNQIIEIIQTQQELKGMEKIAERIAKIDEEPAAKTRIYEVFEERFFRLFTQGIATATALEADALREGLSYFQYSDDEMKKRIEKKINDYIDGRYTV